MSHAYAARGARQTAVFAVIVGLHFAVFVVIALGLVPTVPPTVISTYPVDPPPRKKEEPVIVEPDVQLMPGWTETVERPDVKLPEFPPVTRDTSSVPQNPDVGVGSDAGTAGVGVEVIAPALRTRPASVAAAINSCYPAASRRMSEEGTVVALVTISATGQAVNWSVAQSSGFARLDAAIACVLRKLEFVAGRRDGQAVSAEARLPIVFRLG